VSTIRRTPVGATRVCPHCRAVILQSTSVCPSCRKHVRFGTGEAETAPAFSPLRVEGSIRHPPHGEGWEYAVVITVKNERGEEIIRQLVAVGAIAPGELRTFSFGVDVYAPDGGPTPELTSLEDSGTQ